MSVCEREIEPLEIDIYYQREIQTLFTFFYNESKDKVLIFVHSLSSTPTHALLSLQCEINF